MAYGPIILDFPRAKVIAFAISSFIGGVAGVMFAMQQQYLTGLLGVWFRIKRYFAAWPFR